MVAGGSGANEVKIFDGKNTFLPCAQINNLSRACYSMDFNPQGNLLATGGGDGVVRVFSIDNSKTDDKETVQKE